MLKTFIERPVLSTVISVIIVILGILGLMALPISQYPEIAPPTVQVSASYAGANADVILKSVIVPLEEQINGVEDMSYMTSTANNDGSATIQVYFKLGTNPDLAAVNVQNRVARATPLLPAEVTQAGVVTQKRQSSMVMIFALTSNNPAFDQSFLQNYANINILPQIKRVTGVGDASVFGQKDYSMRIWLKPDVMATYGLIPKDIQSALAEQNIEAAPGKFGENGNESFQYTIKYTGRLVDPEQFQNIIVRTGDNGQMLRLKDVARVELGELSYASYTYADGKPAIGVAINQTAGSNAHQLILDCQKVLNDASKTFPPGVKYMMISNANDFLDASIEKVMHTLIEAFILVFIVVFVFLQDLRSTLIPAIAVPVAIVGTFFFLNLFGFTINLLTLFALVLAIGIVVDDAIVVVEAVHAKLDAGEKSAKDATLKAMSEISGAIVSITLVMTAVFVPVTFITGSAGVFYKQFGLTLAIAIVISAVNALTLSPALCALFLKAHDEHEEAHKKGFLKRFYGAFNRSFDAITDKYSKSVHFLGRMKWIAITGIAVFVGVFIYLNKITPTAFVPNEDQGVFYALISLPPGSSLERSSIVAEEIDSLAHTIPEVASSLRITGQNFIAGSGGSYAMVVLRLKKWSERPGKDQSQDAIIGKMTALAAHIKSANIIFFARPTLQGFGRSNGFELQLQDKTGGDLRRFADVSKKFMAALMQRPEIQYVTTNFNVDFPQYLLEVNVAKCKEANISVNDVLAAMQGYYGGVYASNFNEFGKQFRVMMQADAKYRNNPESLNGISVRTNDGLMVPITQFITITRVFGPESIGRFNLFTAVLLQGGPNPGYSSGDAIKAIGEVAAKTLPAGYGYEFSGLTREELNAGGQTTFIFILCLIFVYFLLAAQYESYILPFAVILSLPMGLAGTFLFAWIFDVQNNIYLQITLIMLIGLLAKNAILIVEFAVQRRKQGLSIMEAALEGAEARLRPILMTSFAFILGLLPLMFSTGAGAIGNSSIGTGAVGGMLVGTLLGVFVIPVLFMMFQFLQEKVKKPVFDQPATTNDNKQHS